MFRKYILPILAIAGVALGIYAARLSSKVTPAAAPVSEASQSPYSNFVAGAGLVEASTENIAIGTQLAGIVSRIYVQVGSAVRAGDPLFTLDERSTRADLVVRQAALKVAEADLADARYELKLAEALALDNVVSVEQRDRSRIAVQKAESQVAQAQANLQSGQTQLDLLTVRAPVDGQILQLKIHRGEFATPGVLTQPLIVLGSTQPLAVRVDVDENDAWRVHTGARAVAYLRGNKDITTPLAFVRFEPYVIPKKSLTGDSTERVDTRVLQIIFTFDPCSLPIFVGQQMDIFIDAAEPGARSGTIESNRPLLVVPSL